MSGKFIIDRDIFSNPIWQNPIEFRLFFFILGKAIWSEEGVRIGEITVKRGQYLRSYRNLRNDLMYLDNNAEKFYGITTIKRAVDKLIKDGRLEKEDTKHGTLFTVVNYKDYQRFERDNSKDNERAWNDGGTEVEQRWNNNKKDKKDKNINTEQYKEFEKKILLLYKGVKSKSVREKKVPKLLNQYGEKTLLQCIENYNKTKKGVEKQYIMHESTFWNGRFRDYLDENVEAEKKVQPIERKIEYRDSI